MKKQNPAGNVSVVRPGQRAVIVSILLLTTDSQYQEIGAER